MSLELETLVHKANFLTKFLHNCCQLEDDQKSADPITLVIDYLKRRMSCMLISRNLQVYFTWSCCTYIKHSFSETWSSLYPFVRFGKLTILSIRMHVMKFCSTIVVASSRGQILIYLLLYRFLVRLLAYN